MCFSLLKRDFPFGTKLADELVITEKLSKGEKKDYEL